MATFSCGNRIVCISTVQYNGRHVSIYRVTSFSPELCYFVGAALGESQGTSNCDKKQPIGDRGFDPTFHVTSKSVHLLRRVEVEFD